MIIKDNALLIKSLFVTGLISGVMLLTGVAESSQPAPNNITTSQPATIEAYMYTCEDFKALSETIMRSRLIGVDILDTLESISDVEYDARQVLIVQVEEAYSKPAYKTEKMQDIAIREFGTENYLNCKAAISLI